MAPNPFLDAHLDLAYLAINGRDLTAPPPPDGCVSLPSLAEGGVTLFCATLFTAPGEHGPEGYPNSADRTAAFAAGCRQLKIYEELEAAGHVRIVRTRSDLPPPASAASAIPEALLDRPAPANPANRSESPGSLDSSGTFESLLVPDSRPRLVLLMEGADPIRGPEDVSWWRERGLALVGLTWANGTRYAGGNATGGALTDAGRDLVAALNAHSIGHDVSHLSQRAFDDLMACATGPVVASHSNCRALTGEDERHLSDAQIRELGVRGGVVGLNLYSRFLRPGPARPTVIEAIDQAAHCAEIMGRRSGVGLGSDMDGGFGPESLPEGVDAPRHLTRLDEELARRGWTDSDRAGFRRENWLTLLHRMLPE